MSVSGGSSISERGGACVERRRREHRRAEGAEDRGAEDYVTVGRFALIPGLWRKEGLGRGGGGWDGVGHVGGRD